MDPVADSIAPNASCILAGISKDTPREGGTDLMNFKQFRQPANGHSRTARVGGQIRGGRGFRLQSKLGKTISLDRLESLLAQAHKSKLNRQRM